MRAPKRAVSLLALLSLSGLALASTASAATSWSVADPPYTLPWGANVPYAPLLGIGAISTSDVWAVGEVSGSPLTENWNGRRWSSVPLPNGPCSGFENSCVLTGVSGDSPSDVIAVGNATINSNSSQGWIVTPLAFHWKGSAWAPMTVPSSVQYEAMQHVQAFSPTNAWAVGVAGSGSGAVATAVHWNGSTWTQVPTPISATSGLSINAISGSSASDIWVVGQTSTGGYRNRKFTSVLMHYDGSTWTQSSVPDQSGLTSVNTVSPTDAWAVAADGSVLSWNGSTWTVRTQEPGANVVQALSPTDVWVGGFVSLGHYNGSSWTTTPTPSTINVINGGAALTPGHVWFGGMVYRANGDEVPAVLSTSNG